MFESRPGETPDQQLGSARQLSKICNSIISLSGESQPHVGALRGADSSHVKAFDYETDTSFLPNNPALYSELMESLKSSQQTYDDLRRDRLQHKKDMEIYQDYLENPDQRKLAVRNDDVRS